MPNPYFKFKQFTIYHNLCAMKVGTDGVLLGAWTNIPEAKKALDIGTGTGLIALMLAQRDNKLCINAIDIDSNAIEQAKENIRQSPFFSQIHILGSSLQDFRLCGQQYDLIVSNPPFFIQSLKSPHDGRTLARHTDSLSSDELLEISAALLTDNGKLSIIYPFGHKETLFSLSKKHNLYPSRVTNVYPTPVSLPKRVLIEFSKTELPLIETNLIIEKDRHVYSDEFTGLVKNFYLKM
ncbi:tRNA1(Val) (adenine(37)-N6)-methyltransferase [Dysgonomonas termitidis]|uniref:tRNA1(Val) (adenine(37)-N6)-methyltransferase n=1 Tax=Dysgonomonas termitidis TaxID=1516126 RepID=A0ABV9KXH8_9BACT